MSTVPNLNGGGVA